MSSSAAQRGPLPRDHVPHVLKTELTVIRGRAQLAQRCLSEGVPLTTDQTEQLRHDLNVIDKAVSVMVMTIDAYGWMTASNQELQRP